MEGGEAKMRKKQDKHNIENALTGILDDTTGASTAGLKAALIQLRRVKWDLSNQFYAYNHREHNDAAKITESEKKQMLGFFKVQRDGLDQSRSAFFKAARHLDMATICKEESASVALQILEQLNKHSKESPIGQARISKSLLLQYAYSTYQYISSQKILSEAGRGSRDKSRQLLFSILGGNPTYEEALFRMGNILSSADSGHLVAMKKTIKNLFVAAGKHDANHPMAVKKRVLLKLFSALNKVKTAAEIKLAAQIIEALSEHNDWITIIKQQKPIIAKRRLRGYIYRVLKYDAGNQEQVLTADQRQALSLMFVNGLSAEDLSEIVINPATVKNVPCLFHQAAVTLKSKVQNRLDPVVAKRLLQGLGFIKRSPWMWFKYQFSKRFQHGRKNAYYHKIDQVQAALEPYDYLSFFVKHLKQAEGKSANSSKLSKLLRKARPGLEKRYKELAQENTRQQSDLQENLDKIAEIKASKKSSKKDREVKIKSLQDKQEKLQQKRNRLLPCLLSLQQCLHAVTGRKVKRPEFSHNVEGDDSSLLHTDSFSALLSDLREGKFDEGFKAVFVDDPKILRHKPAIENALKAYELFVNDPPNFSKPEADGAIFRDLVKLYSRPKVVDSEQGNEFDENESSEDETDADAIARMLDFVGSDSSGFYEGDEDDLAPLNGGTTARIKKAIEKTTEPKSKTLADVKSSVEERVARAKKISDKMNNVPNGKSMRVKNFKKAGFDFSQKSGKSYNVSKNHKMR
jgi:hypothetical protein